MSESLNRKLSDEPPFWGNCLCLGQALENAKLTGGKIGKLGWETEVRGDGGVCVGMNEPTPCWESRFKIPELDGHKGRCEYKRRT